MAPRTGDAIGGCGGLLCSACKEAIVAAKLSEGGAS